MANEAGSYAFGAFQDNGEELERLKRQASVVMARELEIVRRTGLRPGMRVLDLACGPGIVSCALAQDLADSGGSVVGLDLSADLLQVADAARTRSRLTNLSFVEGSVYNLPVWDQKFDFVYARLLFQHLDDPLLALSNIRRSLVPGGMVCIADVDDQWLMLQPELEAFQRYTQAAAAGQRARGGNRFVGRTLPRLLQQAGFKDLKIAVEVFSSSELGLKGFLDITTGFKREQIPPESGIDAAALLKDIYAAAMSDPAAWGAVSMFVASGTVP